MSDLDRYYTPNIVARSILERVSLSEDPRMFADPACGTGNLLGASNDVFGQGGCIGIDRDRAAVRRLRRENPGWLLSVADVLSAESCRAAAFTKKNLFVDLLVVNPPFSQVKTKYLMVPYKGDEVKASLGMAHLLRGFELMRPRLGAIAIVPESLLHSELDAAGRSKLLDDYTINVIHELRTTTFLGARVQAVAVQFSPGGRELCKPVKVNTESAVRVRLVRGTVPVHVFKQSSTGLPYAHSTDLRRLASGMSIAQLSRNCSVGRSVSGNVVLLPRVGLPHQSSLIPLKFSREVTLSDCVIGICCTTRRDAQLVARRIGGDWYAFLSLYRGTGAKYITLSRLREWLGSRDLLDSINDTRCAPNQ